MVWLAHLMSVLSVLATLAVAMHYRRASGPTARWAMTWIGGHAVWRMERDHAVLGYPAMALVLLSLLALVPETLFEVPTSLIRLALAFGAPINAWLHLDRASRDFKAG